MSVDLELERHRATWVGFGRLMRWVTIICVIILAGLAMFVA
jgi:hypothetical protein